MQEKTSDVPSWDSELGKGQEGAASKWPILYSISLRAFGRPCSTKWPEKQRNQAPWTKEGTQQKESSRCVSQELSEAAEYRQTPGYPITEYS